MSSAAAAASSSERVLESKPADRDIERMWEGGEGDTKGFVERDVVLVDIALR